MSNSILSNKASLSVCTVGYFYYSENLNWAAQNLWLWMWPCTKQTRIQGCHLPEKRMED